MENLMESDIKFALVNRSFDALERLMHLQQCTHMSFF